MRMKIAYCFFATPKGLEDLRTFRNWSNDSTLEALQAIVFQLLPIHITIGLATMVTW